MPSRLKSSLSLAELDDVAPADHHLSAAGTPRSHKGKAKGKANGASNGVASDDDADVDMDSDGGDSDNGEETDRRGHYVDVGPSVRRRKANLTEVQDGTLDSGRYRGEEARWKDLEGDDEEIDSDEDEGESDEEGDENLSESSASDLDEEHEEASSSGSEQEQPGRSRKGKSVRFDAADTEHTPDLRQSNKGTTTIASSLSRQGELMSSLRSQAQEDALRGKAIKSQLATWQRALETRIKLEKIVGGRGIGRIHPSATKALLASSDDATSTACEGLTAALLGHSAALLQAQAQLLAGTEAAAASSRAEEDDAGDDLQDFQEEITEAAMATSKALPTKRKRSDDSSEDADENSLEALHKQQLSLTLRFGSEVLEPFMKTTLDRHSLLRNNGDRDGASGSANKFSGGLKALDQSILRQVEVAMSGEGGQRLVERTRKWRGEGERIGAGATKKPKLDAEDAQPNAAEEDAETFDDSDFYSSLLRSLIESSAAGSAGSAQQGGAGAGETPLQFTQFHPRTNTKQRGIDTRASKGRKLRFEVMEKVANFMPRIVNRERWTQEMKDRLFAVLPGRAGADEGEGSDEDSEEEQTRGATGEADLGGIKLFG